MPDRIRSEELLLSGQRRRDTVLQRHIAILLDIDLLRLDRDQICDLPIRPDAIDEHIGVAGQDDVEHQCFAKLEAGLPCVRPTIEKVVESPGNNPLPA